MSIADKITSIEGHLTADYEGLENIGADLTNVNKNIQNIRTCLDNIYSSLPKTTGEGSNLSLTTLKGRINVDDILGNTTQDTYEGYNLLPPSASGTYTSSGATHTSNGEGIYTINGTATGQSFHNFQVTPYTIKSGDYLHIGNSVANGNVAIALLVSGSEQIMFRSCATANAIQDLSSYEGKVVNYVRTFTNAQTLSNFELKPMIVQSSTTKPFEQYVGGTASPNPTYPQDINVVTGTQEVVVQNANYFKPQLKVDNTDILQTRCAVTLQDDEYTFVASGTDMYFGNVGTSGTSYLNYRGTLIKLPNNASKVYVTTTNTDFNANYICWYDENKTTLGFVSSNSAGNSIPSGAKYMNVRIGKSDSVSGTTYKTKVMVRIDDNTSSYIEHQEQTKTLHLSSKNLFDEANATIKTDYAKDSNGTEVENPGGNYTTSYTKVLPNTTYTFSYNLYSAAVRIYYYDKQRNWLGRSDNLKNSSNYVTFTMPNNCYYIQFQNVIGFGTAQLEKGSTATSYEPYYKYEPAKIGTYKNRIFESSGKNKYDSNNVIENALIQPVNNKIGATSECTTIWFKCTPNTTYTLSRDKGDRLVIGGSNAQPTMNGEITTLYDVGVSEVKTYTFNSGNFEYIAIYISRYNTSKPTIVMINEGSTALPYEPYGTGKWYIEKKIGKTLLKDVPQGTNNWTKSNTYSTNDYFCGFCGFASIKINSYYILCNKLINAIYSDTTTSECIANDSESVNLKIKASRLSENSPTGLANYLANEGSDIYIIYILKTPTYEEITNETLIEELNELEKMMSYNGQTNISVSGNLPMLLDVSALKGE